MAKKIEITIKDKDDDEVTKFYSKNLTKVVNKLPAGTQLKVYFQENNFGKQFVGDYITKSPPNQPDEPPTVTCPDGQHEEGGKCVPDIIPEPDHTCPAGQHWDGAQGKCVPDEVEPPVCPAGQHLENGVCVPDTTSPPSTTGTWNSNTDGKWNDGNKRTITVKQPSTFKNDGSIFVAASGSPKLVIDGDGTAHLVSGSGGVDNLSLKLRSRHQAGGDCANRGGGEGFAIDRKGWDAKREKCHNIHQSIGSGNLSQTLKDETWYKVRFTCKDDGSNKIRIIGEVNYGSGFVKECDKVDSSAEAWFFDKSLLAACSWFWIRINNSDHGRIYVCRTNYNSVLELDFKFEPSKNSVGLRNVDLKPL